MSNPVKILAFAGSTRTDSFNKRLVQRAAEGAREAGATVTVSDLRDFPMPLFDQDVEAAEGKPEAARAWKALMASQDAFLVAAPEYNGSLPAVLKNAWDWASRSDDGEARGSMPAFRGKVTTIMSASPGSLGGLRGLAHVRDILSGLGCLVLPQQLAIPRAHEAFDDDGSLRDKALDARVLALGAGLVQTAARLL